MDTMGKEKEPDRVSLHQRIAAICPQLKIDDFEIIGGATTKYNCVASSLGDYGRWWEPTPGDLYYWPDDANRDYSVESYVKMFEAQGFTECVSRVNEDGFEKIAIYSDGDGQFTHVAALRQSRRWSSKLGDWETIEHGSLECLEGEAYGLISKIMKRPTKNAELF